MELKRFFHREYTNRLPNIDSIPQDEEIVLFTPAERPTYEANVPQNHPLPNPFVAGYLTEQARRERQAEHEMGE